VRRRGFTFIEILVTVTIVVVVFGAALMVYNFSNKSRGVTATARALQTAMLIQEHIVTDLGRLVLAGEAPLAVTGTDQSRLSFYAFDSAASSGGTMKASGVVYRLEPQGKTFRLMREHKGPAASIGTAPLQSLKFHAFQCATGPFLRVEMVVGREDGEPPGPDTVHSFLAPINVSPAAANIDFPVETAFRQPEIDEPTARDLPEL
jgi:prepilin-type N-terminal cleavage/methylation domain-containing protein